MTTRSPSGPDGRRRGRARASRVGGSIAILVLAACIVLVPSAAGAASPHPHRILIVSVPTLTWSDLDGGDAPNLSRFLDSAAVADLATRADRQPAKLGAAYVTIGAGTRAAGDDATDGEGLASSERFGNGDAAAAYRQRTGGAARDGLVDLGIPRIDGANANLLYEAHPGALGDELTSAGYRRSVVANGDGAQPDASTSSPPTYFRSAVGALMGSFGRVPGGTVGRQLLRDDAAAPYGVRYDNDAVERAFLDGWTDRSVSVVEASDLVRADRYSYLANSAGNDRLRRDAIRSSDRLFGRLLAHVDLTRDAVLVLAPVPRAGDRSVTVAGLRAPRVEPGLLRSATTRRSGFVTLADVAPTVLDLLGIKTPSTMEGRPMEVDTGHGDAADRRATLERDNANGLLRDELVNPVTAAVLWIAMVLAVACVLLLTVVRSVPRRFPWIRPALCWLSLAAVGLALATMPATVLDLGEHGGKVAFWLFLSVFAVLFAAVCRLVGRRRGLDPLLIALALFLAVLVLDQFTGGHLEFNSVFGYSATVGIRFSGIGNQSSGLLSTAAVLVAALVAWRLPPPWGVRIALVVLAVSFVALTPPLFGQDFGGTLASAPAFALLGWLLLGRRVTVKAIATLVGVLVASGLVVGFLDLLRPSDQRTHVGRFFEKVGNEGFSGFSTVIERKSGENAASFSSTIYLVLIVVVLAAGVALWLRPPRPLVAAVARVPTLRAAAISLTVLVLFSYGLNDSGLAIPAIMLALIAITATYLVADAPEGSASGGAPPAIATAGRAPDRVPAG